MQTKYLSSVCCSKLLQLFCLHPVHESFFLELVHCGCKNNVGPAVSFSSSSCDSLSRILVKGKYFLQLLPLNWKVVFESVFCENVETKFKWRSRRVSDNFQKLLWRYFYGDKSCVICWVMRHIFDKLFKRWMNVYFGLETSTNHHRM